MRAPRPVKSRRSDAKDRRLSADGQTVGGAARRGDLSPCGGAAHASNDGAAYVDPVLLDQGSTEDVAPLTGATPMGCGAFNVHAPQPTRCQEHKLG
jgi:hypothetical protein